ncbi:VirE N-terminal domain-containing protein [Xylanibacter ruminicola]|uniref:VirE N-terminal domain-containing protein n=1 Tax=Xylanibacter ruminicola TaxID=839 RepID=A0A1M7JQW0_XYLRU|nr:BT4734/BF3469 family protein [Xylanibacter ruminicola]SFC46231.1 VirE N-terminal domain-containing protein [Xylanibacter ruminicola]SHM55311.1 VirE N-terminal domain-containing protein [Xylanibacter ruminicola]
MFSYQQQLTDSRTRLITPEVFWAYCRAPQTIQLVTEARQALQNGDEKTYADKKKQLALMIFVGTFEEHEKELVNKRTGEKRKETAMWRSQSHVHLNGLVVADYDHLEGDVRQLWTEAYERLSPEDKERIVLVYVTPSGQGLKPVFTADPAIGNLIDNQLDFSRKLGLSLDESCKDGSRGAFMTTADDIIYINEEKLFTYEDETFSARFDALYRDGQSQATKENKIGTDDAAFCKKDTADNTYDGVPVSDIINKYLEGVNLSNNRHNTLVDLASKLRYIVGRNAKKITEVVMTLPWVQELAHDGEDVEGTVRSVMDFKFYEHMPSKLRKAIDPTEQQADIYSQLPLDKWAEELREMAQYYPCMKELFVNLHPHKLPAVLFSSGALFGTLMTRAWYHFWFDPKIMRRLNYCIFIIGDPGAGKHMIEEFYRLIADPIIQADQCMTDALNRYKESRTERTTSTKAQKAEALKKPEVGIRVHPARTATGEFIRHMLAAKEIIQGQPINLHMLSFDSELDNVNKNNKGGDWKDREIMELKAFHNEEDGQMYANQESISGMFNVYWNFIYTGTPYALHRKVNQRNFGTGMSSRLAVIPLPDRGKAKRHQEVIEGSDETLKMWAYRLDKVAGEIPIEPLNDETYEWQTEHMEIAEFNHDKADRMLLKRIPYYGIGISLPFILMRHWEEWEQNRTLTMDDMDRRFCRMVMEIQYRSQQFFFGEMAFHYFADQDKEFVVRRRTTRYDECYRQLPEQFKAKHVVEIFGCSQPTASRNINRLLADGIIEHIDTHTYRKLLPELP